MKKLFDAINKGDFDTVKQVIEKNPVLINSIEKGWRKRDEGLCPLRIAIKNCHYDIVCFLIDAGANVNDYTPKDDMSPSCLYRCYTLHTQIWVTMRYIRRFFKNIEVSY